MKSLLLFAALVILSLRAAAAPGYESVAGFVAGPQNPDRGALLRMSDGNFYGLSANGGYYDLGSLFKVTPAGDVSVLVHFSGSLPQSKGASPRGGLYDDGAGWLWGTALGGGTISLGTVFKYQLSTRTLVTVAEFTGNTGAVKGGSPFCTLVPDGNGFLWGTTLIGGATGAGTVFKINMSTGVLTTLVEFTNLTGAAPGRSPYAGLTSDGAGNFWGVTQTGGATQYGTVFKVNASTGAFTSVLMFTGASGAVKGSSPHATLLSDGAGFLWGSTFTGGAPDGGTVFKINVATGQHTLVQELTDTTGRFPYAGLMNDGQGFLWGTTTVASTSSGCVFKVNMVTGALTKLGGFTSATGFTPAAPLVSDGGGFYWGTANLSGPYFGGSLYKVNASTGTVILVAPFGATIDPARGRQPDGGLEDDPYGNLWGTTRMGGAGNYGTVFRIDARTGALTTILEFTGPSGPVPGAAPTGRLIYTVEGNLWGVTSAGGTGDRGTVFKIHADTRAFTSVVSFTGTSGIAKGQGPRCRLCRDGGFLWGTTYAGGTHNLGTVFKFDPSVSGGAVTTVVDFNGATAPMRGSAPWGGLTSDGTGYLWGTTRNGGTGATSDGTVYKIKSSSGEFTTIVNFSGTAGSAKGSQPYGELTPDSSGSLWGTTSFGGNNDSGTVFKVKISDGTYTPLISFSGNSNAPKGGRPLAGVTSDGRGSFWGLTSIGGPNSNSNGTIFRIDSATGILTTPFEFTGLSGSSPGQYPGYGPLYLHFDNHLYGAVTGGGVTPAGDTAGFGQVFRIRFGPSPVTLPATDITTGGAILRGTVNPSGINSTVAFELTTDPAFASALPINGLSSATNSGTTTAGTTPENVSAVLTGLTPGTTYYYRIRAINSDNPQQQKGNILSFTTPTPPTPGLREWLAGYGLAGANAEPAADPDGDGLTNALEYIAGTNPSANSPPYPPTVVLSGNNFVCTFQRADFSETPDITLALQTSPDLANWNNSYQIGTTTAASSQGVTVAENGFGLDTITVTIPAAGTSRLYSRLRITVSP